MKINIGSGYRKIPGYIRIDNDVLTKPDYLINLDDKDIKLPFNDDTVEEIVAHHILEHIGDGFLALMCELYRVAKNNCLLDIAVPHHFHEVYYGDPTHKRPITVNGMYLFDKEYCDEHIRKFNSSSGLANTLKVNFRVEAYEFEYDQFYIPLIHSIKEKTESGILSQEENHMFNRLMREANNVAMNTLIRMRVVK